MTSPLRTVANRTTVSRCCPSVVSSRRGSALLEMGLLLALIAGAVVIGADLLGSSVGDVFGGAIASSPKTSSPKTSSLKTSSPKTSSPKTSSPIANSPKAGTTFTEVGATKSQTQTSVAFQAEASGPGWMFAAGGVMTFGSGCLGLMWCRRKRLKPTPTEPTLVAAAPENKGNAVFDKRQEILAIFRKNHDILMQGHISVRHLLSRKPITVGLKATPSQIREVMESHKLRHLMVCDDRQHLFGIISDRDLNRRSGKNAKQLMTSELITVSPETPISPAVTTMIQRNVSCLPVVEEGRLVGILTTTDLMLAFQCALSRLQVEGTGQREADSVQANA